MRPAVARGLSALVFAVLLLPGAATGERLPIRTYTTADGLAHGVVFRIVSDSHGFLWFCTREGLARFDGYAFTSYGLADGLPSAVVTDLVQTRAGDYWVATAGGLAHFAPAAAATGMASPATSGPRVFTSHRTGDPAADDVVTLFEDHAGQLWVGTVAGLYTLDQSRGAIKRVHLDAGGDVSRITAIAEDAAGVLWIASGGGLYRRTPEGAIEPVPLPGVSDRWPTSVCIDPHGRVWVATSANGIARLARTGPNESPRVAHIYREPDGLPTLWTKQLLVDGSGTLWATSVAGLLRFVPDRGPHGVFEIYADERSGLPRAETTAIAEDVGGNLWVSATPGGVARIWPNGFTMFGADDGVSLVGPLTALGPRDLLVSALPDAQRAWRLHRYHKGRLTSIAAPAAVNASWAWNQAVVRDRDGDWWFASKHGLVRFDASVAPETWRHARPKAVYDTRTGFVGDTVLRLFEDSRGDIWVSHVAGEVFGLSRWERRSASWTHVTSGHLPALARGYVSAFAEDQTGNVWIGFNGTGGLARYRAGRFATFAEAEGVPRGQIRNLLVDGGGRLWAAGLRGGVVRLDVPNADTPVFRTYTTADGLSSNETTAVVDDALGRVYVGTARGIDRLDPATGRWRHYGAREGLPPGELHAALRDAQGTLWFTYHAGLVRLTPAPDPPTPPASVLVTRIDVRGRIAWSAATGAEVAPRLTLPHDAGPIAIEFVALSFTPGDALAYELVLDGANRTVQPLGNRRRVDFAGLAAGTYRFLVRAVNTDGLASASPAVVEVTVQPPLWQRWWVLALVAAALVAAGYQVHRARLARAVAVAQMRVRIATDLHDDIGANLTRIAVLSEAARQRAGGEAAGVGSALASIAGVARESVDSMGDIVWAIDPDRDHLLDLTRRMRAYAEDVFADGSATVTFDGRGQDLKLGGHLRRDLFLIFKEAVNNAARHASCGALRVRLDRDHGVLLLDVHDDGVGFDTETIGEGTGIRSMRRRANAIGAGLHVTSLVGLGTTVRVSLPLASASRPFAASPTPTSR